MARARAAIACTVFDSLGVLGGGSSTSSLIQRSAAPEIDSGRPCSSKITMPGPWSTGRPSFDEIGWASRAWRRPAPIEGANGGQRADLSLGEPGLVGAAQEGGRAPVDAVDDEGHPQLVAETVVHVGTVPSRAGQLAPADL